MNESLAWCRRYIVIFVVTWTYLLNSAVVADLGDYHVEDHTIGPRDQQYISTQWFNCTNASACPRETAEACDSTRTSSTGSKFECHSFAISPKWSRGTISQMYSSDYNQSIRAQTWTMYSLGTTPPRPPAPGPPGPTPPSESGRVDYCAAKQLAWRQANAIMGSADLPDADRHSLEVFDALQLSVACNVTRPQAPPPSMTRVTSGSDAAFRRTMRKARMILYVDPIVGDDAATGTDVHAPLRQLSAAMLALRRYRRDHGGNVSGTILLRHGTHHVRSPVVLGAGDSHTTIRAYPGETAVLSGGVPLQNLQWTHVRGAVYAARIPPGTLAHTPSTLFVDGRRAVRSRIPDANPETQGLHTPDTGTGYFPADDTNVGGIFKQQCGPQQTCLSNQTVANFTYGKYTGANDHTVGYAPAFEPYWCGKWTGIRNLTFDVQRIAQKVPVSAANFSDVGPHSVLHMTKGSNDIWANYQWHVAGFTMRNGSTGEEGVLSLGAGGYQFPRGEGGAGWWFIDNAGVAGLSQPLEWYYNASTTTLYMHANRTALPSSVIATQQYTLVQHNGTQTAPVVNVTLADLTFAHTEVSYLLPYETPSGGGYSLHRGAAVVVEGAVNPVVQRCVFDAPGGNGLLLSNYVRGAVVAQNEFKYVGDTAVVLLGSTRLCDATGGNQPRASLVHGNFIHEVGLYGKQGCGMFQSLAMETTYTHNIVFNGPRAGVLWNDGMGGGNVLSNSLLFNLVRETTDHGPFNSWDRVPYVTLDAAGVERVGPQQSHIHHNLVLCNYKCTWPIDHDDGSNTYLDEANALFYGGAKNYLGHSKHSIANLYVFPDGQPYEGSGPGLHKPFCANNDGARRDSSGWGEVYASNRCLLYAPNASLYLFGNCNPNDLNATVDYTFNNTFYSPDGGVHVQCGPQTWTLEQWQARGYDLHSTIAPQPSLPQIIAWAEALVAL
eukprot:m.971050 g.971050  ORF g.971050 m.971050 type:complete len:945 (+) comp23926_c0_seq7:45-2879(+)